MNQSAKRWSRAALIFGAGTSVLGNLTHTVLATGTLALPIRLALAILWPIGVVIAVEVLVRVPWRSGLIDWLGRFVMLVPVGTVAALVSYRHLNSLLELAGEDPISAVAGPVAIDGLMLGGTIALLALRAIEAGAISLPGAEAEGALTERLEQVDRIMTSDDLGATQPVQPEIDWDKELKEWNDFRTPTREALAPATSYSVPVPGKSVAPSLPDLGAIREDASAARAGYPARWDGRKVAEMLLDGAKNSEIIRATGVSAAPLGHMRRAVKILQEEPTAGLPAGVRVSSANLSIIRELVRR